MAEDKFYDLMQQMLIEIRANRPYKRLMSVDEVAQYLGVSRSCVYKWTSRRIIPHSKIQGKTLFFDKQQIVKWALANEVPTRDILLERFTIPVKKVK